MIFFFLKGCAAARMIKDRDGNLLSSEVGVLIRFKEYFKELMNKEHYRERRTDEVQRD